MHTTIQSVRWVPKLELALEEGEEVFHSMHRKMINGCFVSLLKNERYFAIAVLHYHHIHRYFLHDFSINFIFLLTATVIANWFPINCLYAALIFVKNYDLLKYFH